MPSIEFFQGDLVLFRLYGQKYVVRSMQMEDGNNCLHSGIKTSGVT